MANIPCFLLQQYFVCDYAVNVDCLSAEGFYTLNDNFGVKVEEAQERSDDGIDYDNDLVEADSDVRRRRR